MKPFYDWLTKRESVKPEDLGDDLDDLAPKKSVGLSKQGDVRKPIRLGNMDDIVDPRSLEEPDDENTPEPTEPTSSAEPPLSTTSGMPWHDKYAKYAQNPDPDPDMDNDDGFTPLPHCADEDDDTQKVFDKQSDTERIDDKSDWTDSGQPLNKRSWKLYRDKQFRI